MRTYAREEGKRKKMDSIIINRIGVAVVVVVLLCVFFFFTLFVFFYLFDLHILIYKTLIFYVGLYVLYHF